MEVIQIEDKFYILVSSDRAAECSRVLKEGETFAIFDCHGDIQPIGLGEQGIFHEGTGIFNESTQHCIIFHFERWCVWLMWVVQGSLLLRKLTSLAKVERRTVFE